MGFIKKLFGLEDDADYQRMARHGAIIVDVRSKREYKTGHIKASTNIPLDQLSNSLSKFKGKDETIICCCTSGLRSKRAKNILESNGYRAVFNAGTWNSLQSKI